MTKERLMELLKDFDEAKLRFNCLNQANTVGLTPEKRIELDMNYRLALKDYSVKQMIYEKAIDQFNEAK